MKTWVIVLIVVVIIGIAAYLILRPKNKEQPEIDSSTTGDKKNDKTNIFAIISGVAAVLANSNIKLKKE